MGSALEGTQGSEPLFGLATPPTGRDLKEGTVVCFPEPFLPRGKEYDVHVCKSVQGQAVFLSDSIIIFYPTTWLHSHASSPPSCDSDYALTGLTMHVTSVCLTFV